MQQPHKPRKPTDRHVSKFIGIGMALTAAFGIVFDMLLGRTTPPTTFDVKKEERAEDKDSRKA